MNLKLIYPEFVPTGAIIPNALRVAMKKFFVIAFPKDREVYISTFLWAPLTEEQKSFLNDLENQGVKIEELYLF